MVWRRWMGLVALGFTAFSSPGHALSNESAVALPPWVNSQQVCEAFEGNLTPRLVPFIDLDPKELHTECVALDNGRWALRISSQTDPNTLQLNRHVFSLVFSTKYLPHTTYEATRTVQVPFTMTYSRSYPVLVPNSPNKHRLETRQATYAVQTMRNEARTYVTTIQNEADCETALDSHAPLAFPGECGGSFLPPCRVQACWMNPKGAEVFGAVFEVTVY